MRETGRVVGGRFRVDRELWRGPHSRSLLVTDLRNGRPCVLRQLILAQAPEEAVRRFDAQAAILAKFDHPALPRFIDCFTEGEGASQARILVTSYYPGESLERLLSKSRPLSEAQAQTLLRRLVPVLAYLHALDPPVLHRVIKTSGIVIGPDGRPCLTDIEFVIPGLEHPAQEQTPPGPEELALAAPEVFMGSALPASDIYALGLAVVRGLNAENPAAQLRDGARLRLRSTLGVSEGFAAVLAHMLDPSLERRYADAQALEADLARLAGERGPAVPTPAKALPAQPAVPEGEAHAPSRSRAPLAIGIVVALSLLALAAVGLHLRRSTPPEATLVSPAPAVAPVAPAEPAASPAPAASSETPATTTPAEPPEAARPVTTETAPAAPIELSASRPPETPTAAPASIPAPAEAQTLSGRLFFDGTPFADAAAPAPVFWFLNQETKTGVKVKVDYAAGAFTVGGLPPGRYGMSVRIDLNPANPNLFPGDLNAWSEFTLEPGKAVALEVPLRRVMRLLQPADNGVVVPGWDTPCDGGSVVPARSIVAWEPLDPAADYTVSVDRHLCDRGNTLVGTVFKRTTTDAWVRLELPPSREGERYALRLTAAKGGRTIGILTTHGKTGFGWDYRFTVAR